MHDFYKMFSGDDNLLVEGDGSSLLRSGLLFSS